MYAYTRIFQYFANLPTTYEYVHQFITLDCVTYRRRASARVLYYHQVLHQLAARAVIKDWEEGCLHDDKHEHEILKKHLKHDIIDLSIKHCIVTQFTSFIAVEKREANEQVRTDGPAIHELVAQESVDILPALCWDETPAGDDVTLQTKPRTVDDIVEEARLQEAYSVYSALDSYKEALLLSVKESQRLTDEGLNVANRLFDLYEGSGADEEAGRALRQLFQGTVFITLASKTDGLSYSLRKM